MPNSKLIDAPPTNISLETVVSQINDYDLCVMHTSVPSFDSDVKVAQALKAANPRLKIGMIGAKVAVDGDDSLSEAPVIDFICRNEFDYTIKEVAEERPWSTILGLSYRNEDGNIVKNPDRPILETMDDLPSVIDVYKRDLRIEDYFIGYLKHPYISVYTGRGCKSRCTFCLWPQTVGGHRYRTRSVENVVEELRRAKGDVAAGEGILLRRRTPSPTTCPAPKPSPRASASSASPGAATPRPMCPAKRW